MFAAEHIRQALIIYVLKLAFYANGQKHYIENIKQDLRDLTIMTKAKSRKWQRALNNI
ncbi:hypothetical protein DCCM_2451 [Desulfocucumis palustris]|uniref:Uncharacterized protein n=1 Tax=Desulfocucumis palustris TaxID=1898651 RepID=A0A2L2XBA6_9FIRM|nr:hypothetical protein DCCM_2451 [Desulfocucumis palustris]